jgi:hypothetical protein
VKAASYTGELRMLFAVVAVAAAPLVVSAFASPSAPAPVAKPVAPIVLVQPVVIQMATPRTMPSGAPACGNVAARVAYRRPR